MSDSYFHLTGLCQTFLFQFSLAALVVQLKEFQRRRELNLAGKLDPTEGYSLGIITSGYSAFLLYFIYSFSTEYVNYYLIVTRLPACIIALCILAEIKKGRKNFIASLSFFFGVAGFIGSLLLALLARPLIQASLPYLQAALLVVGLFVIQGQLHQIWLIRSSGSTGAIALKARWLNFIKDVSTVAFALSMGMRDGWPIILINGANGGLTLVTIFQFDWAKKSPIAAEKRRKLKTDLLTKQITDVN